MLGCLLLHKSIFSCLFWEIVLDSKVIFHWIHLRFYAITNNQMQMEKMSISAISFALIYYDQMRLITHSTLPWTVIVLVL